MTLRLWPKLRQGKEEMGQEQVSAKKKKKNLNTWGSEETFPRLLRWIEYNLGVLKGFEFFEQKWRG